MELTPYRLPDGRVVMVDASAAKDARIIDFTLADGTIADAIQVSPAHPIHEISAWSGNPVDESPICGADKNDADVWGHRTVYTYRVTCEKCLAMRAQWAALSEHGYASSETAYGRTVNYGFAVKVF